MVHQTSSVTQRHSTSPRKLHPRIWHQVASSSSSPAWKRDFRCFFFPLELAKIYGIVGIQNGFFLHICICIYAYKYIYMIVTMNELRISCEFNLYRYLIALDMYKNLYNIDSVQLLCRFIAEIRKEICSLIQVHYPQNPGCSHRRRAGILFGMLQHSPIMTLPFIATIYPHQLVRQIRRTRELFILKKNGQF